MLRAGGHRLESAISEAGTTTATQLSSELEIDKGQISRMLSRMGALGRFCRKPIAYHSAGIKLPTNMGACYVQGAPFRPVRDDRYLAYNLSLRDLEEMMAERGLGVDHSTVHRWVVHFSPILLKRFNRRKRAVGSKWHMDETRSN